MSERVLQQRFDNCKGMQTMQGWLLLQGFDDWCNTNESTSNSLPCGLLLEHRNERCTGNQGWKWSRHWLLALPGRHVLP